MLVHEEDGGSGRHACRRSRCDRRRARGGQVEARVERRRAGRTLRRVGRRRRERAGAGRNDRRTRLQLRLRLRPNSSSERVRRRSALCGLRWRHRLCVRLRERGRIRQLRHWLLCSRRVWRRRRVVRRHRWVERRRIGRLRRLCSRHVVWHWRRGRHEFLRGRPRRQSAIQCERSGGRRRRAIRSDSGNFISLRCGSCTGGGSESRGGGRVARRRNGVQVNACGQRRRHAARKRRLCGTRRREGRFRGHSRRHARQRGCHSARRGCAHRRLLLRTGSR